MNRTIALSPLLLLLSCTVVSTGTVTFHWDFAGATCVAAGVDNVKVQLGAVTITVPCIDPNGQFDGTTLLDVPSGNQSFSLVGYVPLAGSDVATYQVSGTIAVNAGEPNPVSATLDYINAPTTGDVAFLWSFAGASCAVANVDLVTATIAGTTVTVSCLDPVSQLPGLTFTGVPVGSQSFTLTGSTPTYDANYNYLESVPTYQYVGTIEVQGGVTNATGTVDLPYITPPPTNPALSNIAFLWTFGGQACAGSQVNAVRVQITDPVGGDVDMMVNCVDVGGTDGVQFTLFSAGTYPFALTALNTSSAPIFQSSGTAVVDGVSSVSVHTDMQAIVSSTGTGDVLLNFSFVASQGAAAQTCQQVGVDTLHIALTDSTGAVIPGTSVTQSCSAGSGISVSALPAPATYYVYVQGFTSGTQTYQLGGYPFTVVASPTASSYQVNVPKS